MNNYKEIKPQWEKDKEEFKAFFNAWGNDWKKLGWNALIPITLLVAFITFIAYTIAKGH